MMNTMKSRRQSAPVMPQQQNQSSTVRDAQNSRKQKRAQQRTHKFRSAPPTQQPEATHSKRSREPCSENSDIPQSINIQDDFSIASTIASVIILS